MFIIQKTEYFDDWLNRLRDTKSRAKILTRLKRVEIGNLGDHKAVGHGVFELRIDYGPGFRVYFMRSKGIILILLIGGDKSSQTKDINKAQQLAREIGA